LLDVNEFFAVLPYTIKLMKNITHQKWQKSSKAAVCWRSKDSP